MSATGSPKGECRTVQHEGAPANFSPRRQRGPVFGASVAVAIALAGLAIIVNGFQPEYGDALFAQQQPLAATFDRLSFDRAFAYADVLQAAVDALTTTR